MGGGPVGSPELTRVTVRLPSSGKTVSRSQETSRPESVPGQSGPNSHRLVGAGAVPPLTSSSSSPVGAQDCSGPGGWVVGRKSGEKWTWREVPEEDTARTSA